MMQKIKLVQIIADSELGGGPAHVLGILKNIDKDRFDCYLICPKGYLANEAKKIDSLRVVNIKFRSKFDVLSIPSLKGELEKIQSGNDPFASMVVHSHGPRAGFFASLAAPRLSKKIFTEHNYALEYRLPNLLNNFIQRQVMSSIYRKNDCVIAVSSAVRNYLLNKRVPERKLALIPNAVNAKKAPASKTKTTDDSPVIGTIANLLKQKGQIYLIRALPKILVKYPSATLKIIGEGKERENLEKEIKGLGIEKSVKMLGRKKDPSADLSSWDVFVLPSTAEPFGIVILEAMQAGVPVVATRVGGIVDIIENKKNGLLVENKNPEKIASAVIEILGDPDLAKSLKEEGLKTIAKFSWPEVVKKIENVYLSD